MPPSVLLGLVSGRQGGGQRVALSVARDLVRRGSTVGVLVPDDGTILEPFRALGACVYLTGALRSYDVLRSVAIGRRIQQFDVLYTHTTPVHEGMMGIAARVGGCDLVMHRHSLGHLSPRPVRRAYQRALWRMALHQAREVIAVSRHVADQVQAVAGREAVVVPNGVAVPLLGAQKNGELRVGFVGRLDPNKRVEDFIEAAAIVSRQFPKSQFQILGGGGRRSVYEAEMRVLAVRRGFDQEQMFLAESDSQEFLRTLDILVLPSQLEGHPVVVLEAMAFGKAVVVTDIPGNRETVVDGVTGVVVPVRDSGALANAIANLLRSPERRRRLGALARKNVLENHTEERMLAQLMPKLVDT